ncbi:membrane domain protein [Mycobacterium phage Goldilocks]|nr:membrane domain protein [Mycobacterium phage Goldilocks]
MMNELLRHDETPTSKFLANAYYVTMFSAVGIGSLLLILAVLTGRAS